MRRRNILLMFGAGLVSGCTKLGKTQPMQDLFALAEDWHMGAHRALAGPTALVREYRPEDISPFFRGNGNTEIDRPEYRAAVASGFADWQLKVSGLVENPRSWSLDELKALPQRTQITRHDCVEGWSAIGQWTGPQLSALLERAALKPEARYIVFRCADDFKGNPYYESVDLVDALHPQTIVAHALNGEPLPVRNGAPLRVRIERQLGYKSAKYLTGIEAVASLEGIEGGKGGYWEDRGYHWYAGA